MEPGTTLQKLFDAVQSGNIAATRSIIRQNPALVNFDLSETDEHRVIHFAVLQRNEPMVRTLMKAGADAHKGIHPRRDATTAYVFAKEREYTEIAAAIEEEEQFRREDMSCPNATVSPAQDQLHSFIRNGDYSSAIAVLDADPDLANVCDRDGGTALHIAAEEGALPVIDWLLEHRANPRKENAKGIAPVDAAVLRVGWKERQRCAAFPEVARRLLLHGANMSVIAAAALGDLDQIREFDQRDPTTLLDALHLHQVGLLSIAVTFGQPEALELLLDLGLEVNERHLIGALEDEVHSEGKPLWLAAAFEECEMAQLLLERGADPMAQVYASGSPVMRAYSTRNEQMIQLLTRYGGRPEPYLIGSSRDIRAAEELLRTDPREEIISDLLWGAACGGSPEITLMCLHSLDWSMTDPRWFRILTGPMSLSNHAPHSDHPELFDRSTYPECLRLIVKHGVDINLLGRKGETVLHSIIASGKIWGREIMTDDERNQFAVIVLEASPDLTIRDNLLESTPLGWACRWGRYDIVEMLLKHGADPLEAESPAWATPLAWAEKMGYPLIVQLLKSN